MAEDTPKTDGETFAEYQKTLDALEAQKAQDYAEAGTLPPGVVTRNPDTTTPEANYVSRDNIVVSGASPAHIQAAVEALATDESRDKALDAADVAQSVSREDYDAAILAARLDAPAEAADEAPQEVADLETDDPEDVASADEPRASGGAQVPEELVEKLADEVTAPANPDEPQDPPATEAEAQEQLAEDHERPAPAGEQQDS